MSKFEDNFCGGQFWNYSLIWQSEQPDFTPCFQKTILSWIPLTTILLFSLFELPSYLSRTNKNRNIRLNPYNISKLFLTLLLILVNVAELIYIPFAHQDEYTGSIIYPADYTFGITFLVSHMLSFILLLLSLKYGVRASYTQFLFYFVCVVCESIIFRSLILQNKESNNLFIMITLQFGLSIILFFLNFFADRGPTQFDNALKDFQNGPEISASVPSKFTFAWVTSLIWKGLRNTLDATMLWTLHPTISSNGIYPIFHSFFGPVSNKAKCANKLKNGANISTSEKQKNEQKIKISVFSSLLKTFGYEFFLGSFFQVLVVGMSIVGPQIQKAMILHVNQNILVDPLKDPYAFAWKGIFYASLLLASSLLYNICNGQYNNKMYLVSMKVRTCLNSTIYRKSLRLSNTSRKESTVGQIVNLMQVDVSMIMVSANVLAGEGPALTYIQTM
jgi:ATP-binding cassette subfamily C (CFTR/MRP) protein 1